MSSPSHMPRKVHHVTADTATGVVYDRYAEVRALAEETDFVFGFFVGKYDSEVALALTDMTIARKDADGE